MSTKWDDIYNSFFNKIEKDYDFFNYNNISNEEAIELATKRAKNYLIESISTLTLNCTPDIDFHDYNEESAEFNINLTKVEIDILAELMREQYFDKDLSLLKAFQVRFSPKDLTVFSPANERKTFMDMVKDIIKDNRKMIANYAARDRLTGKLKTIDYSRYEQD